MFFKSPILQLRNGPVLKLYQEMLQQVKECGDMKPLEDNQQSFKLLLLFKLISVNYLFLEKEPVLSYPKVLSQLAEVL